MQAFALELHLWFRGGQAHGDLTGVGGDLASGFKESGPELLRFPAPSFLARDGNHLRLGHDLGGEHDHKAPELVVSEGIQRQIRHSGVLGMKASTAWLNQIRGTCRGIKRGRSSRYGSRQAFREPCRSSRDDAFDVEASVRPTPVPE